MNVNLTINYQFVFLQIWRTEQSPQQATLLLPPWSTLPPTFQRARAFHLGIHPEHPPLQLLSDLRQALDTYTGSQGLLSIETFTKASTQISTNGELWKAIQLCDSFSANEDEARSILGKNTPGGSNANTAELLELTSPFVEAGARWCTLRRGADGAVVHEKSSNTAWSIPAVAGLDIVDTTGCGNAFCGGFLAGIQSGLGAEEAGMWATAAASLMAEHQGVPQGIEMGNIRQDIEIRRRISKLQPVLL